jgi:hypothetical protein
MTTPQTRPGVPASAGVLPAGAGISGIGAGYRLQTRLPGKAFPGVRSGSDLPAFTCQLKPWTRDKGLSWINGSAIGFSEDGESDCRVSMYERFALARSGPVRDQVRRNWSPAGRARTESTAGD